MTSAARALQLLDEVLALAPVQRAAFMDSACGDDAALRAEVAALLAVEQSSEGFLEPLVRAPRDRSGERIGPWKLIRELGHGGMGTVYLAERADDLYTKRIALKLLRFDVDDLRTRFVTERRILATLDHPNIARLLDAGIDAGGVPFVAMEYVEGQPITRWCDEQGLHVRARIALFLKVLDAVQCAHGRLIVHRDLKPANILVERGEPKLLDFGIAKLIDATTTERTMPGLTPLTPEYASPEQVTGEPTSIASDIYALGVLLFELLAGARPYKMTSSSVEEINRVVCQTQPRLPSEVARLQNIRLDHDLDHVILRAMAKPVNDRYASCSQFADDLRRYLAGQPVSATHAGWRYRCRKFIGRYRVAVSVAVIVAAAIVGSAVIAIVQARSAREQMHIATTEREKAERANLFLKNMLAAPDPDKSGRDVTAAQLLDKAATELDAAPDSEAQVTASMRITLAETYYHLGLLDPAVKQMRAAIATFDTDSSSSPRDRAYAAKDLGEMLAGRDDTEARNWLQRAVASDAPQSDDIRASAENSLGQIARRLGDRAVAADHYQRAVNFYASRTAIADDDGFASALVSLAVLRADENDAPAALALVRRALDIVHAIHPPDDALTSRVLTRAAYIRKRAGDVVGAEAAYQEALGIEMRLYGEGHQETIMTLANLAGLRTSEHRYADAEPLARRAYDLAHAYLPTPHIQTANAALALGASLYGENRARDAVPLLEEASQTFGTLFSSDSPLTANAESLLGIALAQSGSADEGERLLHDAVDRLTKKLGPDREETQRAAARLRAFQNHEKYEPQ